jgi:hypothetical protein
MVLRFVLSVIHTVHRLQKAFSCLNIKALTFQSGKHSQNELQSAIVSKGYINVPDLGIKIMYEDGWRPFGWE